MEIIISVHLGEWQFFLNGQGTQTANFLAPFFVISHNEQPPTIGILIKL